MAQRFEQIGRLKKAAENFEEMREHLSQRFLKAKESGDSEEIIRLLDTALVVLNSQNHLLKMLALGAFAYKEALLGEDKERPIN